MNTSILIEEYKSGSRNFQGRLLGGLNLGWANLDQADFRNADFYGANLSGASLKQANLSGNTNLAFTDLSRSDLTAADLRGANLQGANLEGTVLVNAVYDERTVFPRGFDPDAAGAMSDRPKSDPIGGNQTVETAPNALSEKLSTDQPANPNHQDALLSSTQPESAAGSAAVSSTSASAATASKNESVKRNLSPWLISLGLGIGIPVIGLILLSKPSPETAISSGDISAQSNRPQSSSQPSNSPAELSTENPSEAPSSIPSEKTESDSRSTNEITKEEAVTLIENWLKAKKEIFGPSYDTQLLSRFVTGSVYTEIMAADGSLPALKQDNGYYRYGRQEVISSGNFEVNGAEATVDARVIEDLFYYSSNTLAIRLKNLGLIIKTIALP